jgi:hypothetical protein
METLGILRRRGMRHLPHLRLSLSSAPLTLARGRAQSVCKRDEPNPLYPGPYISVLGVTDDDPVDVPIR